MHSVCCSPRYFYLIEIMSGMETSRSTFAEGEIELTLGSMRSLLQCIRVFVSVPCEYTYDWASWDWSWYSWWSPGSNSQTSYRAVEVTCSDDEKLPLGLLSAKAVTKSRTSVAWIGFYTTQLRELFPFSGFFLNILK